MSSHGSRSRQKFTLFTDTCRFRTWDGESHGLTNPAFADVVDSLNTQDQDFCRDALADFEAIIQHLQQIPIPG
ncbi:hypothetical protein [Streptomyces naganishii]|uniref:hypothetical protein n=1 Tax=Streptomyces naganishii TaxID=285447 RepID=UPI00167EA4B0|nr:hypothetical protein [Streptomyces naganishii]